MPEACFLCLDSTEYMRNGDQFPNRMLAEQEAANLLVNAKIQANAENTVGFLAMGGAACTVFETLTLDVDRVMATLTRIPISGKRCHFSNGLLIASLALSHRTNPRAEKRIVAFVGSPLQETAKDLEQLGKRLRKDDVAVDVVAFGAEDNMQLLQGFIDKVNKGGNSRLLGVERSANLTDALMSSAILLGEENLVAMGGGGGGGGASGGFGFGIDPNTDPELALALRLSMEEEERRQAANAGNDESKETAPADTAQQQQHQEPTTTASPSADAEEVDYSNMSEEEMLRRALAMSLQEANVGGEGAAGAAPATTAPASNENEEDEEFQRQLQQILDAEKRKSDEEGGS